MSTPLHMEETAMTEPSLRILTRRLDRLERENSWWRCVFAGCLIVSASMGLMGQDQPKQRVLEVERLVIRDSAGRVRVTLGPERQRDTDSTLLQFYGNDGKGYAFIGILNHKLGISSTLVLTANQNPS